MAAHHSTEKSRHSPALREPPDSILDDVGVCLLTTLPRAVIVRLSQPGGEFPRPVVLCGGRIGWRMSEVQAWIASRVRLGEAA